MKGMVFSEFIELVEEAFSIEMADIIVEESKLPSGGAYTSVGTYDHGEIVQLVGKLSEHSGIPVPDLLKTFGEHLAVRFAQLYPDFFSSSTDTFSFLSTIENHVHVEVKKLYPDAELPTFTTEETGDGQMNMVYSSFRPFADLAEGLIKGSIKHFGENIDLQRKDPIGHQGTHANFILTKKTLA